MHLDNCISGATIVPIHPKRILYNKVPKCGSTTLNSLLTQAGKANGYNIVPQNVFRGSRLNSSEEVMQYLQLQRKYIFVLDLYKKINVIKY